MTPVETVKEVGDDASGELFTLESAASAPFERFPQFPGYPERIPSVRGKSGSRRRVSRPASINIPNSGIPIAVHAFSKMS